MPLYDYLCETCGLEFEEFNTIAGRETAVCPSCRSESCKQQISCRNHKDWFSAHWNEGFAWDPIYVKDKDHYRQLCKLYGVQNKCLMSR